MGLFDLFKSKSKQPENTKLSLEQLLQKAPTEPAYRAEFYNRLLIDTLIVLTQNTGLPEGNQTLKQNTRVNIVSFPNNKIPLFTSKQRIFDRGIVKEKVEYMEMKGASLFELAKGATFLLNPYSDYGKELLPDEIERILNGKFLTDTLKPITIQKDVKVQIGQPAKYPTDLVNSLKILFANWHNINAAYLAWIYNPDNGEPPHYIFGLDGNGDLQTVIQEAGFTAKQFLGKDEFVDFIQIGGKGDISSYLRLTAPFYKR